MKKCNFTEHYNDDNDDIYNTDTNTPNEKNFLVFLNNYLKNYIFWQKHRAKILLSIIWILALIIEIYIWNRTRTKRNKIKKQNISLSKKQLSMCGNHLINLSKQKGGNILIPFRLFRFFIYIILSVLVIITYIPNNRCVAYGLAFLPPVGFPTNRFYTKNLYSVGTIFRALIPFSGLYDIYAYKKGILKPNIEFKDDSECKIF